MTFPSRPAAETCLTPGTTNSPDSSDLPRRQHTGTIRERTSTAAGVRRCRVHVPKDGRARSASQQQRRRSSTRTTRWSPDSCRGEIPGAVAVTALPHAAALQAITRAWPGAGAFVSAPVKGPFRTATRCARADRARAWSTVDSPSAVAGNVCAVGYLLPGGGTVRRASNPPCPPEHCPPEVWREMESSAPPPSTGVKRWKDVASPSPVHTSGSVTTYPGWAAAIQRP